MQYLKKFESFNEAKSEETNDYPKLKKLVKKLWDGDVTYKEATSKFSAKDMQEIEECLMAFSPLFKEGVPFPGDDKEYDEKVGSTKAGKLIQKMIDTWE